MDQDCFHTQRLCDRSGLPGDTIDCWTAERMSTFPSKPLLPTCSVYGSSYTCIAARNLALCAILRGTRKSPNCSSVRAVRTCTRSSDAPLQKLRARPLRFGYRVQLEICIRLGFLSHFVLGLQRIRAQVPSIAVTPRYFRHISLN